ncbi:PilX N-terminal domain-containing pilus assembly protein [Chromobacterium sp. S0633]|nr:PilX N-terminal domain-containing pilus assembly protein [Chromobacterium sp. S0633]MCP1288782.1 PilX N-terminal domain-containing pilus assembly protein [Chromobacterium sp. S0633]
MTAKAKQQGFSLLVALIFLTVLAMLGFGAVRSALMEEKLGGNNRERAIAFMAAEVAMRQAETYIATADNLPASGTTASGTVAVSNSAASATYTISYVSTSGGRDYYLLRATGYGGRKTLLNTTQTQLESVVWVEQ